MKKSIFFILFIVNINIGYSQVNDWIKEAQDNYSKGNYNKAIEIYQKVLDHTDKHKFIYSELGFCYLFMSNYKKAIDNFNIALDFITDNSDIYNARGLANAYEAEVEQALEDFNKAIQLDPKFGQAYLNRASLLTSMGNFEAAYEDLNKAKKYEPNNPEIYFQLGRNKYISEEYNKAIEHFKDAVKNGLKTAQTYFEIGNCYFKMRNFNEAIKNYTETLKLDPKFQDALNNRAVSYDNLNKKDLADKDRERLGELTGLKFPNVSNLKFKTYTSEDKALKISLPIEWKAAEEVMEHGVNLYLTPKNPNNIPTLKLVNVVLSINRNMEKQYGFRQPQELIEFWKQSVLKNNEELYRYEISSQKIAMFKGNESLRLQSLLQVDFKSPVIRMYELIVAKEDVLIYAYFQSGEREFDYYKDIFEKAISSFEIN